MTGLKRQNPPDARCTQALIERAEGTLPQDDPTTETKLIRQPIGNAQWTPAHRIENTKRASSNWCNRRNQAPKGPPPNIINLAEGAQAKTGEILFIIGRPAGVSAGPPAAVKRLTVGTFGEVSLTNADMMMGGTLPEKLDITVRVDGDGNPLTRMTVWRSQRRDGRRFNCHTNRRLPQLLPLSDDHQVHKPVATEAPSCPQSRCGSSQNTWGLYHAPIQWSPW